MRKYNIILIVALAICLIPLSVSADEFHFPPEDWWLEAYEAPKWRTPFPYQRNIRVDFSSDPISDKDTLGGIPGAIYEGWLDDDLMESDYVSYTGDVYYDSSNGGRIGVSNGGIGSGIIHIDNLDNPSNYKNFWIEAEIEINSNDPVGTLQEWIYNGYFSWDFDFGGDAGSYYLEWSLDEDHIAAFEGKSYGQLLILTWGRIYPNPEWEEIQFTFDIPKGEYAWINDVHVATECVPIPSALWLLGSGLIGIVGIRRKFKN